VARVPRVPSLIDAYIRRRSIRAMKRQVRPERFGAFGEGSWVDPPLVCYGPHNVHIGRNVTIRSGGFISCPDEDKAGNRYTPRLTIGDGTHIGRDVTIACIGSIEIGRDVYASDRLLFADSYHGYEDPDMLISEQPMVPPQPVKIGDGTNIGLGAMVMPGVTIGRLAVIGAGAVVTRDVPDNAVVVGNPARVIRWFDRQRGEWVPGEPPA
jgi:acetyltransferase-like isoleucine patch superfamily enzyme